MNINSILAKISKNLLISLMGNILGVITAVILFIVLSYSGYEELIAKFSLLFIVYFGFSILCLHGNDIEIIATSKNLKAELIIIDNRLFRYATCLLLNLFFFFLIINLKKNFVINITLEDLIIIHIAIAFNNLNKFFQAFFQASSKLVLNSLVDFLRYVGFFIFLLLIETVFKFQISYFFLAGEICAFSFIVLVLFKEKFKYRNKNFKPFTGKYSLSCFSHFSYQGILKLDVLVLSIISDPKIIVLYSIVSNVVEGVINVVSSFHPFIHNYVLKNNSKIDVNKEYKNIKFIKKIITLIAILLIPAYLILNYLIFLKFPNSTFILIIIILSLSILLAKKLFMFFNYFSLNKKPIKQFTFSISFLFTNLILNVIFYNFFKELGIALATSFSYCLFYFILNIKLKDIKT